MAKEQFNRMIEEFEINMLEMTHDEKIDTLMDLARKQLEITGQGSYSVAELLIVLEQTRAGYVNLALCRIICNLLFIHDN